MPTPGLSSTGFTPATLEEILAGIGARQRELIHEDLANGPDSVMGRINGIFAERIRSLWEALDATYHGLYPDSGTGVQLANTATITGTTKKGPIKSRVLATVSLNPGTTLVAGNAAIVSLHPAFRYEIPTGVTVTNSGGSPADFDVWMEAATAGADVTANAGRLNEIATPVSGWTAVTNALDSEPGADEETDYALRIRREIELASGASNIDAIRSHVLKVPDVTGALVFENTRGYYDEVTDLQAHTMEAIVENGDDQAIRQALWDRKPGGISYAGTTSGTVTDGSGNTQPVKFSRPVLKNVWLQIALSAGPGFPGADAVAADIAAWGNTLGLAEWVYVNRILCRVLDITGVQDVIHIYTGFASGPTTSTNLRINAREKASFDTSRIGVFFTL